MNHMKKTLLIAACITGILTSCNRANRATDVSEDNDKADLIFSEVFNSTNKYVPETEDEALNEAGANKSQGLSYLDSCATVTWSLSDDSTYLDTIVIDYGENTTCESNGRVKRGKLNIYMNGRFREQGNSYTVIPENFYVDDHKVEGSKTITNLGLVTGTLNWQYSVNVEEGVITTPDNEIIQWESSRTHTWKILQGQMTIEGTANGVARNGTSYNLAITDPLVIEVGCRWITEGTLELTPDGLDTRSIDYGNGDCDNDATVSINNRDFNINLW